MLIATLLIVLTAAQNPSTPMHDRGAMVMGFDQEKTAHHFYLYQDGGAIEVIVKDAADKTDLAGIRMHLPHIATIFGEGNFDAPLLVHDTHDIPGIDVLAAHKADIRYSYVETPTGGRVNITTTDPAAVTALHDFLRYQIREHQTGDPGTVSPWR